MYGCGACGLLKVAADFYRDLRYPEWTPRSYCKACMAAKRKAPNVHWLAKPCTGCRRMVPMDGFYFQKQGWLMQPCKACRAAYRPARLEVTESRCSKCKLTKPAAAFGADANKASRLASWCLTCTRARRPATIVVPSEKRCPTCDTTKPADEFYRTDRRPDGLYARCKNCHNARAYPGQKRYKAANKEQVAEWNLRWHHESWSPEAKAASIQKLKEWNAANPDEHAIRGERRRARIAGTLPNDFTGTQFKALKTLYRGRCAYCGKKPKPPDTLVIEHVIPVSKGGPNTLSNIVPSCGPCNDKKHANRAPTHQPTLLI